MLEKATKEDIAGFQSYTIRNMYTKLSIESDIEQFKLLKVKESISMSCVFLHCFPMDNLENITTGSSS